jgi:4-alpha-glucanotransferase
MNKRASGILLHPTSLPGPWPIGDLGPSAQDFVDFLFKAGQSVWQILPLGPTGYGHSPYNTLSAFAGNPVLIHLERLVEQEDLAQVHIDQVLAKAGRLAFHQAHNLKQKLLWQAAENFFAHPFGTRMARFRQFCQEQQSWLDDFCLFMALKDAHSGQAWVKWPRHLRRREPSEMQSAQHQLADQCDQYRYQQFVFFEQWHHVKDYAHRHNILIFGDIPFFVAYDSADVWSHQHLFQIDEEGQAMNVAGVPPDYFSATGQLWGNPLYRWPAHQADNFSWWLKRFAHQLHLCDLIRIDHFRGLQACWSVPGGAKTAEFGHWDNVPGRDLLAQLEQKWPDLPIVAEDLGVITPEVEALRDEFNLPGMKVLQFAFDSGADNPYLPQNHTLNSVVYTGTHDNDTTLGWWQSLQTSQKKRVLEMLQIESPQMPWDLIRTAMASLSQLCILPCQDILSLDSSARFNRPGSTEGNWQWQLNQTMLTDALASELKLMTRRHERISSGSA